MDDATISRAAATQAGRLDKTLSDLQSRVKEQEAALEKLRLISREALKVPSPDASAQLRQLRILRTAYEASAPMEPYLPPTDSPLPSLLALRTIHQTITDTKSLLASTEATLENTERKLEKELADVKDANLITQHLEMRIESLRRENKEHTQKSPDRFVRDIVRDIKKKQASYDKETGNLIKAFNEFIDTHLASMLAAEELGGPVVGDLLEVDELALESGFNSQGTMKRHKGGQNEDKRQRRIDEIWGQDKWDKGNGPWDETRAAGAEMRDLTEQLLNNLVEATSGEGDGYVQLERESAAARYLVRSKVAQFHPRDAQRLRLIDFGRDLDD